MALTWVWVGMVCVALIYGAATGQSAAVGAAAGVCCIARKRGKKAQIVIDMDDNAAGPILKRGRPRAQGRMYRINKRTSHITIVVAEKA